METQFFYKLRGGPEKNLPESNLFISLQWCCQNLFRAQAACPFVINEKENSFTLLVTALDTN